MPASLSPSAAVLAHRRGPGEARRRGAARKAERATRDDMVGVSELCVCGEVMGVDVKGAVVRC